MSTQNVPVVIFKEGTQRSTGRGGQRNNMAAKVVAETVKTALEPRGMDNMLVSEISSRKVSNSSRIYEDR